MTVSSEWFLDSFKVIDIPSLAILKNLKENDKIISILSTVFMNLQGREKQIYLIAENLVPPI